MLEVPNLIGLATLFVTIIAAIIALRTGVTSFTTNQSVKGNESCNIKGVKQDLGDRASLNQSIECSEGGIIEDVEQK